VVVAGNEYLAAYARARNSAVSVIPTPYLDLGGGARVDAPGEPPVIVWIGNVGNEEYLELVRAPLEDLAKKYDFVLRIIGSRDAARVRMQGVNLEVLEWREDRERDWLLECAIGIMPLNDRDYERGKCSFKLVQYLSAGMPVVASPVGMNNDVVQDGVNGFLAGTPAQWHHALDRLLGSAALRREMGARGYATFRSRFTRERNAGLWLDVFARLCPGRLPLERTASVDSARPTLPADFAPGATSIRAAFDVHVIGRRATGNETYADGLLNAFEAQPPADVDLLYYHSRPGAVEGTPGRYRRIRPDWPYARIAITTPYYLQRDRIDVAHFQYFAPPLSPCPSVLTIHDLSYERHPEFFSPAMAARMKALMPWMARRAARIIAVSEATRRDLVDLYGLDPAKVDVIYNGTSPDFRAHEDRDALRRTLARLRLARPFIVCVGNLGRRKNQVRVVRAFGRLVRERGIEHDLVLIGKEEFSADAVRSEILSAGVAGRVHVAGFVSRAELVALYNLAEFSVYPSLYEGFGLPIVESMACATPVITSTASCMPEIAGGAALLVDPLDDAAIYAAMDRMLGDTALRESLRGAGLARSRAFTWRDAARRTLETYRRAAQARAPR
jgi:glycosyltransferase involved in cell wall biosynthesis